MAKERNKPSNKEDQPVQFRRRDAQRIGNAVHSHETGRRGRNPSSLPRAAGGGGGGGGETSLEEVLFAGPWPKGTFKQVFLSADTAFTSSISVGNFMCSILPANTALRRAYVSTVKGTTVVIAAET